MCCPPVFGSRAPRALQQYSARIRTVLPSSFSLFARTQCDSARCSSVPPLPSPLSAAGIVETAHPRSATLVCWPGWLALRSLRQNLMRLGGRGLRAKTLTRNSSCRRTSPWSAAAIAKRPNETVPAPQAEQRLTAKGADLPPHIRTKRSLKPWEKPRFKRRSTRSVSIFMGQVYAQLLILIYLFVTVNCGTASSVLGLPCRE